MTRRMLRIITKDVRLGISLGVLLVLISASAIQPILPLPDPDDMNIKSRLCPPSLTHLLGTDEYGRDILSRILSGSRTSLLIAFSAATVAGMIGTALGILAGHIGGLVDLCLMRVIELLLALPPIVVAVIVVGLLGGSIANLIIVISLLYVPYFARLAYSMVKSIGTSGFVEAARAIGASDIRILIVHLLPNALSPLIVQYSLSVAAAVLLESGLSFLGIGVRPPTASLGQMIGRARGFMYQSIWYVIWPSLWLSIIILCLNLLGDSLRDYLDPRTRLHLR